MRRPFPIGLHCAQSSSKASASMRWKQGVTRANYRENKRHQEILL
jgi:hypothetical protein